MGAKAQALRALLNSGENFIAADVYTALTGRIVQHVGFKCAYLGGAACGAMHYATFDVSTHYPLVRGMQIEFLAPGKGRLSASATLPDDEIERIRAAAVNGKVPFELVAEVTGEDGTLVARTRGDYQIRPYGS